MLTIGLDIGGTKINGSVFDGKKVVRQKVLVTPKKLKDFRYSLGHLLNFLNADHKIRFVGVGIPGIADKKGVVSYSPNMRYLTGFNIQSFIGSLKYRCVIDNDAKCFALAESRFGKGRGYRSFIGLTLGTGIGSGIIINKQLYRGANGSAGEAGHMMADANYSYEFYFQKLRHSNKYRKMGIFLGRLFADLINLLDPEVVILGGTVALRQGEKMLPVAIREAKKYILNPKARPELLLSNLKNAGAIGAALLAERGE